MIDGLLDFLICPQCQKSLEKKERFAVCLGCGKEFKTDKGKVYLTEVPPDAAKSLQAADPTNYKKWTSWRKANYQFFKENLSAVSKDKRLLDLGAGPSQFRDLTKKFQPVISIDFYPYELVDIVADLTKTLPFKDNLFDIILLSNVIEHIPDVDFLLKECHRILKKDGLLIGTVPFLMRVHQKPYDFHRFTYYMLDKMLNENRYKNIVIRNLATSLDLYKQTQLHFFYYLLSTKFSKNYLTHHWLKFLARIIWRVTKSLMFIFRPIFRQATNSPDYTLGYGFKAHKKI